MVRIKPESRRQQTPHAPPVRFARGWYCLGIFQSFHAAGSRSLQAFGQRLLVHTDSAVALRVFLDEPGQQRELPALEQDGLLFIWHDPQRNPPPEHLAIPRITGDDPADCGGGPAWSSWFWAETALTAQTGQVMERLVRPAQSSHATAGGPLYFKNVFEGHLATQYFEGPLHHSHQLLDPARPVAKLHLANSVASYFGPAVMLAQLDYVMEGRTLDAVVLNAHYPIDDQHLVLMTGVMVRIEQPPTPQLKATGAGYAPQILQSITNTMQSPLPCSEDVRTPPRPDSPLAALQRWYSQFFVDADDVDSKMTERFEYELDTSITREQWARYSAPKLILRKVTERQLT